MFIPYETDAPVYHLPITTGALIATNVVMFVMTIVEPEYIKQWYLPFGELTPLRWVTSNLTHGDIFHLLGNMFGLWSFGLVVEGKVGALRMLAIVALIGLAEPAIVQVVMLGATTGGAIGFSGIVFGLMAICLIWAPENEMSCLMFLFIFYAITFDVTIYNMATILLILNFVGAVWSDRTITTEMLHLIGAVLGGGIGLAMLRQGWVECENWDIFSCIRGLNRMTEEERERELAKRPEHQEAEREKREERRRQREEESRHATEQVRAVLANGNAEAATKLYEAIKRRLPRWELPEPDLRRCIQTLHEQQRWEQSLPLMLACIRAYPANATVVQLKLAEVLLLKCGRPGQALRTLEQLAHTALPEALQQRTAKLVAAARQLREQNPYEVIEEW
ncbi:MAG: rhomboid family intramembrane serine protease [Planctomycetales bacterium]|nr:rhomboid family intramembrane serine protease [Planctomycetales bacterium]